MKLVNIITYNNQYGLTQDVSLLVATMTDIYKSKVKFNFTNFYEYRNMPADINIFLETPSKMFFPYAPINILIPNQEWYYKSWIDYTENFDYILTKSNYAKTIFTNLLKKKEVNSKKIDKIIKNIGWKSKDMYDPKFKKNYKKCLHLCGASKYKHTQDLINNWDITLPELTIIYNGTKVKLIEKEAENIIYINNQISEEELQKLMNENGIHICCSETEGFGHYIHEAKSCKSVVLTTDGFPMKEYINNDTGFLIENDQIVPMQYTLGEQYMVRSNYLNEVVKSIQNKDTDILENLGENARNSYLYECQRFESTFKTEMDKIFKIKKSYSDTIFFKNKQLEEEDLPKVSIVTLTHNRRSFFKLAIKNFQEMNYPMNNIEWVIVDDGSDSIFDMLPKDERIVYKYLPEKMNIGGKRNLGVKMSKYDIIAFMDDDDYYYPESLKTRIEYLNSSKKDCIVCTTIGCFDINKYISIMNVPPHQLPFHERVSEATLTFYKTFWEEQSFNDLSEGGEGSEFIINRSDRCLEINWENIIVSLLHSKNTSTRVARTDKPNGCHYGFDNELFLFITELDKEGRTDQDRELIARELENVQMKKKKMQEDKLKKEADEKKKEADEKKKEAKEIDVEFNQEFEKAQKLKRSNNGKLLSELN
jgi:glycosyltransferase involved in cell wall biosynthesis